MKICNHCGRINPDDTKRCIACCRSGFEPIDFAPQWLQEFEKELQQSGRNR